MNQRASNSEDSGDKPGINFNEMHQRLASLQESLAETQRLTPERAKQVMDERARQLARVPEAEPDKSQVTEVITFRLGEERLAIETRFVREVAPPCEITPLPGTPEFVIGLTNLRGEVLSVMNLRTFFGIPARTDGHSPRVLVLGGERNEFGVEADVVEDVVRLRFDEMREPPGSVAGISRDFLRGVTSDALLVIDGQRLVDDERLYIDQSE